MLHSHKVLVIRVERLADPETYFTCCAIQIFTGISAVSLGIALLSQLGSLEFVSFSANNPATYKLKDTPTTVTPYKSLDSLKPPEIKVPSTESSSASKEEISSSSMNENKPTAAPDAKVADE